MNPLSDCNKCESCELCYKNLKRNNCFWEESLSICKENFVLN